MLTCQAEHVDSTCRRQGSKAEWTQEMLRLVEADEVGFQWGPEWGMLPVYMGV